MDFIEGSRIFMFLAYVFSKNPVISNESRLEGLTARIQAAESAAESITSTWHDFETPKLSRLRLNIWKIMILRSYIIYNIHQGAILIT